MMINLKLLAEDLRDPGAHPDNVRRRALLKVDVLRREAERLQSLFDEFLSLTSPCRLERIDTDVNTIVARLVEFFEPLARNQNIEVQVSAPDKPVICGVDETLLSRALLNIVINAQEAMPDGGVLRVSTREEGDWAILAIEDTGVGISTQDREKILRPFFSSKGTGTGLGLSITQRIIQEHRGKLDFESKLGEGTTFTIRLPRAETLAGIDPEKG